MALRRLRTRVGERVRGLHFGVAPVLGAGPILRLFPKNRIRIEPTAVSKRGLEIRSLIS